ncbi:MAG: Ig-like domain-containing protein [Gammaproteobacteria bacterium]|nr:Ig-like domain-containing protein [Gammaproteobacteria bacterium]
MTLSFDVKVTDDSGVLASNSDTETVTLTLTGTNDAPVLTVDTTGGVTEDAASPNLTDNGTLSFTDVDVNDTHSTSASYNTDAVWSGGSLTAGQITAITSGFTVDGDSWDYSVANSALQFLGAGETITLSFDVKVTDDSGVLASNSDTETVTLTLTGTNDAPVLNTAAIPALASIAEDAGAPVGAVGTLVSSLVDFNPPAAGLNNVSDADSGAVTGIAITGTNSSNGTWWYSTNNGGTWTAVGTVTNASALLLAADANTRLYFQGNSNFNGTVSDGLTFRAWDQTSGAAGTKVSTATNGGTSAFSSATDTASITVSAVNDNPVAAGDRIIVSSSTAVTIAASSLLANDTDADGLSLSITGVSGATGITGLTLNADGSISFTSGATAGATAGSFQYTVSDGAGGTNTATVTIDVRTVSNGNGQDTVDLTSSGAYQASYIDGRGGADTLTGGAAGDIFIGGTGNSADILTGAAGNDLLIGGDGNDTLSGGAGNDVLRGGTGNTDFMDGGAGNEDMLDFSDGTSAVTFTLVQSAGSTSIANGTGGLGNNDTYSNMEGVIGTSLGDNLTGSAANDIIRGGAGNDTLNGAAGTMDLIDFSDGTAGLTFTLVNNGAGTVFNASAAGLGTDTYSAFEGVIGTAYADTLTGSASVDQLRGGGGNDILDGAGGNDILVGGAGADLLTGGTGSDTFVYRSGDASAVDTITDFTAGAGGDVLDISDLLTGTFAGNESSYLSLRESGGNTIVSIDRDGAGSSFGFQDFVVMQGVVGLNLGTLVTNGNIDGTP